MNTETNEVEITGPATLTFAQRWHAEKLLKKAKKKKIMTTKTMKMATKIMKKKMKPTKNGKKSVRLSAVMWTTTS